MLGVGRLDIVFIVWNSDKDTWSVVVFISCNIIIYKYV